MGSANDPWQLRVAIVGSGLGGACLAIGLQKHANISYQLYEAASSFGTVGLGITLGVNAQRAMTLIDSRAEDVLHKVASTNLWKEHLHHAVLNRCASGPRAGETFVQTSKTPIRTAHRARLLDGLVEFIDRERCHFNKRLTKIEQPPRGSCPSTLHFEDGSTAQADLVIGADGVHSVVRKHVLGPDHPLLLPRYTGAVAYRGILPMERVVSKLGEEIAQNTYLHFGKDLLTLSYPVEGGELVNLVLVDLGKGGTIGDQWTWPTTVDEIRKKTEGFIDTVQGFVELLDKPDLSCWALYEHPTAPTYYRENVVIMGDGAHAMTPFQGSGASQAIEDALVLENVLSQVRQPSHIAMALAAYDQVRRPRKQRVAETSIELGRILTFQHPDIGDDFDNIREVVETRMNWIWYRDLNAQNEETIRLFKECLP